ncbi:MAG TPA: hypothetical protein VL119_03920 [Acidimicrobiia bacterium]|nr:hypothetical protein [Acidimicrobiia bacterium]
MDQQDGDIAIDLLSDDGRLARISLSNAVKRRVGGGHETHERIVGAAEAM